MHVKPVLFMSVTKSIKENGRFGLYEVKMNENTYHISHPPHNRRASLESDAKFAIEDPLS